MIACLDLDARLAGDALDAWAMGRRDRATLKWLRRGARGERWGHEIALALITANLAEDLALFGSLDAFSHDRHAEFVS